MTTPTILLPRPSGRAHPYDRSALQLQELAVLQQPASVRARGSWATTVRRELARLVAPIHDAISSLQLASDRIGALGNRQWYERARPRATWPILRRVQATGVCTGSGLNQSGGC